MPLGGHGLALRALHVLIACGLVGCGPSIDVVPPQGPATASSGRARADSSASSHGPGTPPPKKTPLEGYVHVARREHVSIGLAEAREIDPEEANRVVDRLTERFEACAVKLEAEGQLAAGAGRLVVLLDEKGHVTGTDAKLAPGSEVAGAALLCLLAPARALAYPPGKGSRRGFAVEAVWEPSRS